MKRAFIGFINGAESEPVSDGETVVCCDGESSTGETESLYQLQDGRFGGCSDGDSILDPLEPLNRVAIFMAGTQPTLQSSTAVVMISGSASRAVGPALAGSSPVQFIGCLDDISDHRGYPGDSRLA